MGRSPALWVSELVKNGLQRSKALEVKEALQFSDLQLNSYDPMRCCDPPEVSIFKAQSGLSETVEINGASSEPDLIRLIEISEFGPNSLFITEAIKKGPNRIPESSTLMLLGLVLVGLAGYGGRKKFKR